MDLSFLYHYKCMQRNGVMHRMKWMSVGNDGMVKMVSIYSIYSCGLSC